MFVSLCLLKIPTKGIKNSSMRHFVCRLRFFRNPPLKHLKLKCVNSVVVILFSAFSLAVSHCNRLVARILPRFRTTCKTRFLSWPTTVDVVGSFGEHVDIWYGYSKHRRYSPNKINCLKADELKCITVFCVSCCV